ncbi:MAG: hypothetical protein GY754_13805 [bacterium]|nr:hypothetical protein [bacterium]
MKAFRNIVCLLFILIPAFFACEVDEETVYTITIDGYKANFSGYYYLNGSYQEDFTGTLDYTDGSGYGHYYFEKELGDYDSIKVYSFKNDSSCTLTMSIWKDNLEVATETSGEDDGCYDSDGDDEDEGCVISVGPLYYEGSDDDDSDDDDDDS